jgi:hypothetical protein
VGAVRAAFGMFMGSADVDRAIGIARAAPVQAAAPAAPRDPIVAPGSFGRWPPRVCSTCLGEGIVATMLSKGTAIAKPCPACDGTGRIAQANDGRAT